MTTTDPRRRPRPLVLAYRALGLGDLLTAVPALRALRRSWPEAHLVLAAPSVLAPLARLIGAVDELLPTRPFEDLRVPAPDLAVNLHGRGPRSHVTLLACRPAQLVAFACPAAGVAGPRWQADEHEVHRWCRLLDESGIPADPMDLAIAVPARPLGRGGRAGTVVHPGAASPARRWPVDRFAEVARAEQAQGRRVVVTGSPEERPLALELARLAGLAERDVLAGKTDLAGLVDVVAGAERLVCGDTGVAHLATALGTPSVVLFGPTSPALWGPPPGARRHRALWAGLDGDPHGNRPGPGLLRIPVGAVLDELRSLDEEAPSAAGGAAPAEGPSTCGSGPPGEP